MRCPTCGGLALYEKVVDTKEGVQYEQWVCVNCGRPAAVSPLRSRVPVNLRQVEPLGRWARGK